MPEVVKADRGNPALSVSRAFTSTSWESTGMPASSPRRTTEEREPRYGAVR